LINDLNAVKTKAVLLFVNVARENVFRYSVTRKYHLFVLCDWKIPSVKRKIYKTIFNQMHEKRKRQCCYLKVQE